MKSARRRQAHVAVGLDCTTNSSADRQAKPYVIVTGGIAAGKSTLTTRLADALGVPAHVEHPERNPFLASFYERPDRWALSSLTWFLLNTLDQQREITEAGGVQEHSSYEGVEVYGKVLLNYGSLEPREHDLLGWIAYRGLRGLRNPDLIMNLVVPLEELRRRIGTRGRDYEANIELGYLDSIDVQRRRFLASWDICPVISVDTTTKDVRDPATVSELVTAVIAAVGRG